MFSLFGWTALSEVHPFSSCLGITQSSKVTGCFDCLKASKEDWLSRKFPGAPKLLHCTQPRRGSTSGPPLKQQRVLGTAHTQARVGKAIAMLEITSSASPSRRTELNLLLFFNCRLHSRLSQSQWEGKTCVCVCFAGFPLLSSRKPGLQGKDNPASCQAAAAQEHSPAQVGRAAVQGRMAGTVDFSSFGPQ